MEWFNISEHIQTFPKIELAENGSSIIVSDNNPVTGGETNKHISYMSYSL